MWIYQTTNKINGKRYIGKQVRESKAYYGSGMILKQAITKYGKENFEKVILETVDDKDLLNEREIYWIGKLKPEYNITDGGTGGDTYTNNPNKDSIKFGFYGGHIPWNKGVPMSEEARKKMSEARKGCKPTSTSYKAGKEHPFYGKKRDAKIYEKIVATRKAKGHDFRVTKGPFAPKKVVDGNGKVFDSIKEAAEYHNISRDIVGWNCRNNKDRFKYYG